MHPLFTHGIKGIPIFVKTIPSFITLCMVSFYPLPVIMYLADAGAFS